MIKLIENVSDTNKTVHFELSNTHKNSRTLLELNIFIVILKKLRYIRNYYKQSNKSDIHIWSYSSSFIR
jgi:hypothetical protein